VQDIVRMRRAGFEDGTIPPAAGFTICVDPEAAQIVFAFDLPLVVMPPNVTPKALPSRTWVEEMQRSGTPAGQPVASRTDVFERFDIAKYGSDGTPLHDPCVIASLLQPALFDRRHINVEIETKSELTPGMTVADGWRVTGCAPNAMFLGGVDREGLCQVLSERLGGCDGGATTGSEDTLYLSL
jgi:purine nucleosidase